MPVWALQIILAAIPLISKLIDRLVPNKVDAAEKFKPKAKAIDGLEKFRGRTVEEIARIGRRNKGGFE